MGNCTYKNSIVLIAGGVVAATSNNSLNAFMEYSVVYFRELVGGEMKKLELDKTLQSCFIVWQRISYEEMSLQSNIVQGVWEFILG